MNMKSFFHIAGFLLLLVFLLPLPAMADAGDQAFENAKNAYQQLQSSTRDKLYRENWVRVVEGFEGLARSYPSHSRADDALYLGAKASEGLYAISRRAEDARQAVALYDRLAAGYPQSNLADDACYLAGLVLEKHLSNRPEAYMRYKRAADNHPRGDMTSLCRDAEKRLRRYMPAEAAGVSVAVPAVSRPSSGAVKVSQVRHWSSPDYTRVVIETTGPAGYAANLLQGNKKAGQPPRLYVDVKGGTLGTGVPATRRLAMDCCARFVSAGRPEIRFASFLIWKPTGITRCSLWKTRSALLSMFPESGLRPWRLPFPSCTLRLPVQAMPSAKCLQKPPRRKNLKLPCLPLR
jgi:N-acetylmuramoyl-L-alanine amidase